MKSKISLKKATTKRTLGHLAIGIIIGAIIFAIIISCFAYTLCQVDLPENIFSPIMLGGLCLAIFVTSLIFTQLEKRHGLFYGAILGFLAFLALYALNAVNGNLTMSQLGAIKAFSLVCCGALGGYIGVARSEKKRKIR